MKTKTELHTHLMGMLSSKELIKLLAGLDYEFPINGRGEIDFESSKVRRIPAKELIGNSYIIEQLSINHGKQVGYDRLDYLYLNRNMLMADLVAFLTAKHPEVDKDDVKYAMYGIYLNECLRELVAQGVEYVEISFSNAKIIDNAFNLVRPSISKKIKCKFLLSTDRSGVAKDFRQSSRHMLNLLNNKKAIGFDIMGSETPLSDLDLDPISKYGLKQKLLPIIQTLNEFENTTLRIHSGETRNSSENTEKVLSILEDVERELKITIPPPEIRIGHGVYFRQSTEYLRLLKKFGCVVEINASSNYALDNVDDYSDIPYNYYLDNDIDIVICSDGHGMYDTTKDVEDIIADSNVKDENKNRVIEFDKIIRKKGGI